MQHNIATGPERTAVVAGGVSAVSCRRIPAVWQPAPTLVQEQQLRRSCEYFRAQCLPRPPLFPSRPPLVRFSILTALQDDCRRHRYENFALLGRYAITCIIDTVSPPRVSLIVLDRMEGTPPGVTLLFCVSFIENEVGQAEPLKSHL